MLTAQGFSAWVSVDGVELPQYAVESRDAAGVKETITCYIPSETNKAFSVNWTFPPYPYKLVGDVRIDGLWISGKGNKCNESSTQQASCDNEIILATTNLTLSSTKDDDAYLASNTKDLGEIRLDVWTVKCPKQRSQDCYPTVMQTPTKIHERSKSAISHRASFGQEISTRPVHRKPARRDRRVVTFLFKYRSPDYLGAAGIIPFRAQPANAATTKRIAEVQAEPDDADVSDDELALQREEEELRARLHHIGVKRSKKRKLGHQPSAASPVRREIIDLT